jgi:hypothetical protein
VANDLAGRVGKQIRAVTFCLHGARLAEEVVSAMADVRAAIRLKSFAPDGPKIAERVG